MSQNSVIEKVSLEADEKIPSVKDIDHVHDVKCLGNVKKVIKVNNAAFAAATTRNKLNVWTMEVRDVCICDPCQSEDLAPPVFRALLWNVCRVFVFVRKWVSKNLEGRQEAVTRIPQIDTTAA